MITFDSVTKRLKSGNLILEDVSFSIEPGEFVILSGPSGAGKTTIMRMLIRDMLPTQGTIVFDGVEITKLPRQKTPRLRQMISVVFQDLRMLPDLTIAENVALPLEIIRKAKKEITQRVEDLLTLVGLADKHALFPAELSGGELQRAAIARALSTGPKVVFADEPTGNLDHENAVHVTKLLKKIQELGTTVLMSTHNAELIQLLNARVISLDQGKITHDTKAGKKGKSKPQSSKNHPSDHDDKDHSSKDSDTEEKEHDVK